MIFLTTFPPLFSDFTLASFFTASSLTGPLLRFPALAFLTPTRPGSKLPQELKISAQTFLTPVPILACSTPLSSSHTALSTCGSGGGLVDSSLRCWIWYVMLIWENICGMGPTSRCNLMFSDMGTSRSWAIDSSAASDLDSLVDEGGMGVVGGSNNPANKPVGSVKSTRVSIWVHLSQDA